MRNYGQYCPVAKGAEILGDRWTLLIVRELLVGPLRFSEIERGLPGISKSVLATRLRRLQRDGVVARTAEGYRLSAAGEELRPVVQAVGDWVGRWVMADPAPAELDPELLMLWISRHVRREALPGRRVVVEFEFRERRSKRCWLLLEPQDISVCLEHPGFDVDVTVRGATRDLYRVYMGRTTLAHEVESGGIELQGLPRLTRAFSTWMAWSNFAPAVLEAASAD